MADSRLSQAMIDSKFVFSFGTSPELTSRLVREIFATFDPITQSTVDNLKSCVAHIEVVWLTLNDDDFLEEPREYRFLAGFVPSSQAGRDFASALADDENRLQISLVLEVGQPLDPQPTTLINLELWNSATDQVPLLRLEAQPLSSIFRSCSFPAIRLAFHCNTGGFMQVFLNQ
mgnify:CR=1 FL=1